MIDPCGCDAAPDPLTPLPITNRPGLPAVAYRVGTYATFFATMKARLAGPVLLADTAQQAAHVVARNPLAALTTREANDPAIALVDAWAVVADVLTFYQERIANEGYLTTATERHSVIELARLVGSSLRPGVSASTHLAYTLDQNSTSTIPAGSQAQSMPVQGQLPQTFETSENVAARGAWNNLAPRLTAPQILKSGASTIYFAGITTNLKPDDTVVIVADPHPVERVTDPQSTGGAADPHPVERFADTVRVARIAAVEVQSQQNRTKITLQPDPPADPSPSGPAPSNNPMPPEPGIPTIPAPIARGPAPKPQAKTLANFVDAANRLLKPAVPSAEKFRESFLRLPRSAEQIQTKVPDTVPQVLKAFHPEVASQLSAAWKNDLVAAADPGEVHVLRIQAAPFGHNAPLKPIADEKGTVIGTEEWSLAGDMSIAIVIGAPSQSEIEGGRLSLAHLRGKKPTAFMRIANRSDTASASFALSDKAERVSVGKWKVESKIEVDRDKQVVVLNCLDLKRKFQIALEEGSPLTGVTIDGGEAIHVPIGQTVKSCSKDGRRLTISTANGISILDETVLPPDNLNVIELDSVYDQVVPGSWVAIDRGNGQAVAHKVVKAQKVSIVRYGMSARVTRLTLGDKDKWLDPKTDLMLSDVRSATIYARSEQLSLAEEPITDPVEGNQIELGDLYDGVPEGRSLIVAGERLDDGKPLGITGAELVRLAAVEHSVKTDAPDSETPRAGERTHSFLKLANGLVYQYKRDTVTIYGNVVRATHGETRTEVLGSGDGSKAMQKFSLHQSPVTHVSAPTQAGSATTLEVRVNDILWHEVATLADAADAGPSDRCYVTHTDDAGKTTIIFGDGIHGMRLPTGRENVRAVYRTGTGSVGNLPANAISQLGSRPFGVKAVIGPLAATGGADPDGRDVGKSNVPLAATALDRLVSVDDHVAFARTFAGVGKASAVTRFSGAQPYVYVTVAGAEGARIDENSDLFRNLLQAFGQLGDPHLPVEIVGCKLMLLVISARVKVLPDYLWESVAPRIRYALYEVFGFARRDLDQSVALSEVISTIQRVSGVAYVDVDVLDTISEEDVKGADALQTKLVGIARPARPEPRIDLRGDPKMNEPQPAKLAFLSPRVPDTLILAEIGP